MSDARLVECQDCGYRWESSASSPRCSKAECGRSRNVEPVADVDDEQDDQPDQGDTPDPSPDGGEVEEDVDDVEDDQGDDGGYTPGFESRVERVDAARSALDRDDQGEDVDDDRADDEDEEDAEQDAEPSPDVPEIEPEQLQPALASTFEVAASSRGEHWSLEDEEAEQLAQAWTPVVNLYAPSLMKPEHLLVVIACSTTASVLKPRLEKDRELKEREEQAEQAARDQQTGTVRQAEPSDDGLDLDGEDVDEPARSETPTGGYANV